MQLFNTVYIHTIIVYDHLSIDNACEDGALVLQFQLQLHEVQLVRADLELVVGEKHPWKPTVTLGVHFGIFAPGAPVEPAARGQGGQAAQR